MTKNQSKQQAFSVNRHFRKAPLAAAIAATLAGVPAFAQVGALEEVIVTAQKRTQNLQDVPISVQVLGGQQLQELNLNNFEDYIKFLPNVSYVHGRPGQARIYMRGVSSGSDGLHSGSLPSVGVYLDEQPVTTIGLVMDLHIYDIERIEALGGPQGTLFGASSQAGTLRIITNKPVIGEYEAAFGAGVDSVEHGDIGYNLEGFVNLPISDRAAIRLVGWHKEAAGYIDNVAGTIILPGNPTFVKENSSVVENDFNTATTTGMRALLKVELNENWTVTPGIMVQQQDTTGIWHHDPEDVGDLKVKRFKPEYYDSEWYQASLTLDGKLGNLDLVYAGAYMDSDSYTQGDYIGYGQYLQNVAFATNGSCYHHASNSTRDNFICTDPTSFTTRDEEFSKQSHELRLQSSKDSRLRWTAGLFYQRQEHNFDLRWNVPGLDPRGSDFYPVRPTGSVVENDLVIEQTDQDRIDRDKAIFGELEYDITEQLTVIGGYRRVDYEN